MIIINSKRKRKEKIKSQNTVGVRRSEVKDKVKYITTTTSVYSSSYIGIFQENLKNQKIPMLRRWLRKIKLVKITQFRSGLRFLNLSIIENQSFKFSKNSPKVIKYLRPIWVLFCFVYLSKFPFSNSNIK